MTRIGYIRAAAISLAALAATLLALAVGTPTARAAFGGENGDIAFQKDGDVWAMRSDGTGERVLTSNYNAEGNPSYSPDGSRIAYEFLRGIWVMNADGSGKRQITDGDPGDEDPAFSADGTRVVFVRSGDLYEMNLDGSGLRNLTNTSNFEERDPAYSPSGDRISYTRVGCAGGAGAGATCVYAMNADGSNQTNLTPETAIPQCPNSPGYYFNGASREPAWSPDATRIAFAGPLICDNTIGQDIWVMNADGTGKTNLIDDQGTGDRRPIFSPDGTTILFESNRDNLSGPMDLYTIPAAGGAIARVTNNTVWDTDADWVPATPACDITGTPGDDDLVGSAASETICGGGGDDTVTTGGGDDVVLGGEGNDVLTSPAGRATLNGGPGVDTASFARSATPIEASLQAGFALRLGTSPLAGVALVEVENVTGSSLGDRITGSSATNALVGGAGADVLLGLEGNDKLNSKDNKNRNDTVNGGPGKDRCTTDAREASIRACE